MSTPFLGEIMMCSFNFAPKGWALCNGQLMPINQNQALFSLMGTMYGGDGRVTFAIPDLRGRTPMHPGGGFVQGQMSGEEFHTLNQSELPQHIHTLLGTGATGRAKDPGNNALAAARGHYAESGDVAMNLSSITNVGGSQAHENRPPFLVLTFVVALQGIFPSRA
jgi:microcystin-dependent protein